MSAVLRVDLCVAYPGFRLEVVHDFPLTGVSAIFGRSGSGKSTLLRAIAGLERQAAGRIDMDGTLWQDGRLSLPSERRGVGYVFQDTRLFPHLTVRGNLDYALKRARGLGGPGLDQVAAALDLDPLLPRRPNALSGGEKQRVAIGRALLTAPRILLMDEPLSALDDDRKAEILPYLERLRDAAGVPMIYVSHSVAEVARLAQYILVLQDGRVRRAGSAQEMLSDPDAAPLFGVREAGAVITARIASQEPDGLTRLDVSGGELLLPRIAGRIGDILRVRILAQDVILSRSRPIGLSALNILPATVRDLREGTGPGVIVQLVAGGDVLLARVTRRSAAALGLAPGVEAFAILKSVVVAPGAVGAPHST